MGMNSVKTQAASDLRRLTSNPVNRQGDFGKAVTNAFAKNPGLASTFAAPYTDPFAGDNASKFAADQERTARRASVAAGEIAYSDNDVDLLGVSRPGTKRRGGAARALLG